MREKRGEGRYGSKLRGATGRRTPISLAFSAAGFRVHHECSYRGSRSGTRLDSRLKYVGMTKFGLSSPLTSMLRGNQSQLWKLRKRSCPFRLLSALVNLIRQAGADIFFH